MSFSYQGRRRFGYTLLALSILLTIAIADTIPEYDFNGDTQVDILDLNIFAGSWLSNNPVTDIYPLPSGDGIVNFGDFSEFAKSWPATESPQNLPYEQFAKESKSIETLLSDMQAALADNQSVAAYLIELQESKTRIEQLGQQIQDEFQETLVRCQNNNLDNSIIQRCISAQQSFLETKELVINSILTVLNADQITLPAVIPVILDVFTSLKLKAEPDFHNSQPNLWEIQSPQDVPTVEYDPSLPAVDVMAEAAAFPPTAMDLMETYIVQITPEIVAEANELDYSPSAMYEYVRNNFEFQPYYASRKGSVETLRQRCGNDYDLATILIALLRASGISARYASGIVEMPVDRANSWLGVDDGQVAGSILYTLGMEGVSVVSGSEVVAVRCRRVWVEAYVSRGRGGRAWVPLDPAFKLHQIQQGQNIPEIMNFNAQGFLDEYYCPTEPNVVLPREETVLELFKQEIADYLAINDPNETVESVKRKEAIISENLGLLPASLPYKVLSRDGNFSEIADNKVYKIRFHISDDGSTLLDHTLNLPEIASKRVTISYIGATQADQDTIDSYDGLLNTPPYLVNVKPVLKVGGQVAATGSSIGAGVTHTSNIYFIAPVNGQGFPVNEVPMISNNIIAGHYQAICLAVHGATNPFTHPEDPNDNEEYSAQLRYAAGMGYLSGCIAADDEFGQIMHLKVMRDVDIAIIEDQIPVYYDIWGNPNSWSWKGLTVDADRKIVGVWKVDGLEGSCGEKAKDFMILSGAEGSLYENRIFEDSLDKESVSTIKILQLASEQGITIYKNWDTLPLPVDVVLPLSVENAIASAISAGHQVTFPAQQITYGQWTGCGYIDMDPCTGAAGYIISGGQNGGSTVVVWFDWLFIWSNKKVKYIEGEILFPDHDSAYAKTWFGLNPIMFFTYRLRAVFDDNSHDYWRYCVSPDYANIQFMFLPPDHYVVQVGEDAGKDECKVTVFNVEIKKSDESAPPEYLPVKPTNGTTPTSESYKAVVKPDGFSGTFHWTGSSNLYVKSPDAQTTVVEPASPNPSGSLRAENLQVTFTPNTPSPFGAPISDDAEHKMTIYDVEVKAEDGTSNPQKYVAVEKSEKLKGIVIPTVVNGKFENWMTTSTRITLSYPSSDKEVVEVKAGTNPSNAVDAEQIKPRFRPQGASQSHEFKPHKMTVAKVEFKEDTGQSYGFDNFTNAKIPWKSVEKSKSDTSKAEINPSGVATDGGIYFKSTSTSNITVSPSQSSASPETVTVNGVNKGSSDIQGNVNKQDGEIAGLMKVIAYKSVSLKRVKIIYINEDNDDIQSIAIGKGLANQTCINPGSDGTLDPNCIPGGDDLISGNTIHTGTNGICETSKLGNDVQVIPLGQGKASTICVSKGTNGFRDTVLPSGDDQINGDDITTGPNGISETSANLTDVKPNSVLITGASLQTFLNQNVFNQSVAGCFTVTDGGTVDVNYDQNRDAILECPATAWGTEPQEIIDNAEDLAYDYNVFIVNEIDGANGFAVNKLKYCFIETDSKTAASLQNVIAHELGHAFGNLNDIKVCGVDDDNLMSYCRDRTIDHELRKNHWDTIQAVQNP